MTKPNSHIWEWKGLKIAWKVEGIANKSKLAIVLIHGFGACKEHWRYNQSFIGSFAPCYAIDLIGYGNSSQPNAKLINESKNKENFEYCFDNWGQQIADFCKEIVQEQVLIVGNSIGGIIALRASQILNNQCSGLILINCAQRTMDDKRLNEKNIPIKLFRPILKNCVRQKWLSKNIFKFVAKPLFIKKILKIAYPTQNNIDEKLIQVLLEPTQREGAPEAFRGFINLFNDYLAPDILKDLNINVDLIWGENDPWEPLNEAEKWANTFQCIRSLSIVKNCGHCPHDEDPDTVNNLILKTIQQTI